MDDATREALRAYGNALHDASSVAHGIFRTASLGQVPDVTVIDRLARELTCLAQALTRLSKETKQ